MTFGKIAASYMASHKRQKVNYVIIAFIKPIGCAVINFADSENILQQSSKGSVLALL